MNAQVLVVEDEAIIARAIQSELRSLGYAVPETAASGEEAIRKAEEMRPDVVLMDIVLQGELDGIETARRLRSRLDVPVVYLSAFQDAATLDRAKATEPYGYLLKPYEEKELQTTIEIALHKHRIENQLRQTRQWLATILAGIGDAVIATDRDGRIRFVNRAAEMLTGHCQTELQGQTLAQVCQLVHPSEPEPLAVTIEAATRRRSGTALPDHCSIVACHGRAVAIEGSVAPLWDQHNTLSGLVVTLRDASARRAIEEARRQSEAQERQAQKMEAVGGLAGGFAHHFNNLLTVMLGNASLAAARLAPDDAARPLLEEVEQAAEQAANLVEQLLILSGRRHFRHEVSNLNELVQDTLIGMKTTFDPRLQVTFRPGNELWLIQADPPQLTRALRNLCLNAQEAMADGGRLVIDTDNVARHAPGESRDGPSGYVRLRVCDTGRGIAPEVQARVFEPFFSTKEVGQGTGLGLALVHGIVHEHAGWVECHSELGQGSRFDIYLPRFG